jgi:hypothetical protein
VILPDAIDANVVVLGNGTLVVLTGVGCAMTDEMQATLGSHPPGSDPLLHLSVLAIKIAHIALLAYGS